jgi:putative transposase
LTRRGSRWGRGDTAKSIQSTIATTQRAIARTKADLAIAEKTFRAAEEAAVEIIRTPFRAPNANAFAERWVGTVRRDCLDWLLITSRRPLEHVLRVYVDYYNRHRSHRALDLTAPIPRGRPRLASSKPPAQIHRRDRLGRLIHEYAQAA